MTKECRDCEEVKPVDEFYKTDDKADGSPNWHSYCKPCHLARNRKNMPPEKLREYGARYRARFPEHGRAYHLKVKYGITLEDYDRILAGQDGGCAICGSSEAGGRGNRFHIDHCHTTGRIRGLLCIRCNQGLGYFSDDPAIFRDAISYLLGA